MAILRSKIRVRFAPSPTGYLHLGGLRTALYNYLYAKNTGGTFILRIEDTDRTRLVADGTKKLITILNEMGLAYDEGPILVGQTIEQRGNFGPYIQSERLAIYKTHAEQLLRKKKAYYCFCASERLEQLRQEQIAKKLPTMYDKKCLALKKKEIERLLAAHTSYVVRLNVPAKGESSFIDAVYGQVSFQNKLIDDQVLLKSDGFPTYHLANVVDDHLMKISTVIRGEEWLPSTPKHLLLYKAFSWKPPQYAHLPLLLNPDKSKLSKRQGDVAVENYLDKGYLRAALINFIAFLGWNAGGEQEFFTKDELIKYFSIAQINKSGAVFNLEKLDWLNAHYLKQLSADDFYAAAMPYLLKKYPNAGVLPMNFITAVLELEKERITKLNDVGGETDFFFAPPADYPAELLLWKTNTKEQTKRMFERLIPVLQNWPDKTWNKADLETELKQWITLNGLTNGDVLWPLRVAVSGKQKSPPPFDCLMILGRVETINRIKAAIKKI